MSLSCVAKTNPLHFPYISFDIHDKQIIYEADIVLEHKLFEDWDGAFSC